MYLRGLDSEISPLSFAVIGQPVQHSLSPTLFRHLFGRLNLPHRFEGLPVGPDHLRSVVEQVRRREIAGLSVTLPHKEPIVALLDELTPSARAVGAVNCVSVDDDGRTWGHNTDSLALRRALDLSGFSLDYGTALILGAGGSARAAAVACLEAGVTRLFIVNRTRSRAERLVDDLTPLVGERASVEVVVNTRGALRAAVASADAIVQCTSVGLQDPTADPLRDDVPIRPDHLVVDLVYRPLVTALLDRATAAGAQVIDGLWLLIFQALEALPRWLPESTLR